MMRSSEATTEFRRAWAALRRSPGTLATGVLTIAIGIGAATAIFALVDHVLIRPLPVHEQHGIVVLRTRHLTRDLDHFPFTQAAWIAVRHEAETLERVAAVDASGAWLRPITGLGGVASARVARIGGEFFDVLGPVAFRGRLIEGDENVQGSPYLAVLGQGFWQRAFGGDVNAIGATMRIADVPHTIVGVLPHGFDFPRQTDVWVGMGPYIGTGGPAGVLELDLIARRTEGATPEQVRTEVSTIISASPALRPTYDNVAVDVRSFTTFVRGDLRPLLVAISASALLVLLVAGTNLANLLLVRAVDARRSIGVRRALGGRGIRVVAPLVAQSLILAALGGAAGALGAGAGCGFSCHWCPAGSPRSTRSGSTRARSRSPSR